MAGTIAARSDIEASYSHVVCCKWIHPLSSSVSLDVDIGWLWLDVVLALCEWSSDQGSRHQSS